MVFYLLMYLKGRLPEKEGKTERQRSSLYWFIPQKSAIVVAGLS